MMTDVTRILNAIEEGDTGATDELLPLIYEELRVLAAQKLSQERPGQTLQATALVHEAYIRLVGDETQKWESRGHFFTAAAEAMRRILVEKARRKQRLRHGGGYRRVTLDDANLFVEESPNNLIALDEEPLSEGPGTVISRYKLLEKIGEGGMAIVYMAEQQEPIHRKVALKIIKLGMDTKSVIARFEAERQALAMMDHLNTAKVLAFVERQRAQFDENR